MGVKNQFQMIHKSCQSSFQPFKSISRPDLTSPTLIIDASTLLYKYISATQTFSSKGLKAQTDQNDNKTAHLLGILYFNIKLLKQKINPVWIFDGNDIPEKSIEIQRRRSVKEKSQIEKEKALEDSNFEQALKHSKRAIYQNKTDIDRSMQQINQMGTSCQLSKHESDQKIGYLLQKKIFKDDTDVYSSDSDMFLYGINRLWKKDPKLGYIQYKKDLLQDSLGFDQNQFIDYCLQLGTDYSKGIPGVGPKKAFDIIKKFGTIETASENNAFHLGKKDFDEEQTAECVSELINQRKIFLLEGETFEKDDIQVTESSLDINSLKTFLAEMDFASNRIDKVCQELENCV